MKEDISVLNEPLLQWGGSWTEEKLDAFTKYVNAYLTIMNKNRDRYGWKLIYFDGFAGSGSRQNTDNTSELLMDLFGDDIIRQEELNVYQGAAERVLSISQRGFDYNYFIDKDMASSELLKIRLKTYSSSDRAVVFRCSDANNEVKTMARALKADSRLRALVLLDPFGMQVNWDAVASLTETHTDLWILVPTGVIVNRLLDRRGELSHIETLCSFFGLSEYEIRNYFYEKSTELTLFGEEEKMIKVSQPIKRIAELYIMQLKRIFKYVTDEPLVMYNRRNVPIYHFAFASNNETARKIASQIITKKKSGR